MLLNVNLGTTALDDVSPGFFRQVNPPPRELPWDGFCKDAEAQVKRHPAPSAGASRGTAGHSESGHVK